MNDDARRDAYRRQTGRRDLTPRPRRRADHKQWRQALRDARADATTPTADRSAR